MELFTNQTVMDYKLNPKIKKEYRIITFCILNGMSNIEISKRLNYSKSTVAYKINKMFSLFDAKNRIDFILKILEKKINEKDMQLNNEIQKNNLLKSENKKLKNLLNKKADCK